MNLSRLAAALLVLGSMELATGSPTPTGIDPSGVAAQAPAPSDPPVFGQLAPLAVEVQPNEQALGILLIGQQTLQKLVGGIGGPLPRADAGAQRHPARSMAIVALLAGLGIGGLRLARRGRVVAGVLLIGFGSLGVVAAAVAQPAPPARLRHPKPGEVILIQVAEGDQVRLILDRVSLERLNELAKPRGRN